MLLLMPPLVTVDDVAARGDALIDLTEDVLAEAVEDPDEILAPGRGEREALVLGTCDVDESPRAESLNAEVKLELGAGNRVPGMPFR